MIMTRFTRNEEVKDLEFHDDKLVVVTKKELNWRTIEDYRNKIEGRVTGLYHKVQELEERIKAKQEMITYLENENKQLHSAEVDLIIQKQKETEQMAHSRALDLLREHIGLEAFTRLIEKHYITWENGSTKYKLTDRGKVFRRIGKEWQELCVLRPKSYPLPDAILAILVSVKTSPHKFRPRRRG